MHLDRTENHALLRGWVEETPALSHHTHGLAFYRFPLLVPRLSGREDQINVLLPGHLLEACPLAAGDKVAISGEVRSFNNRSGAGSRLVITLLARTLSPTLEPACNDVILRGALCKPPSLRQTPLGRDICDMLLAVNRKYHRADYLPCIAWGTLALYCAQLHTGDTLLLKGRLQSRDYLKTVEGVTTQHTAFEVSVMSLDLPEEVES